MAAGAQTLYFSSRRDRHLLLQEWVASGVGSWFQILCLSGMICATVAERCHAGGGLSSALAMVSHTGMPSEAMMARQIWHWPAPVLLQSSCCRSQHFCHAELAHWASASASCMSGTDHGAETMSSVYLPPGSARQDWHAAGCPRAPDQWQLTRHLQALRVWQAQTAQLVLCQPRGLPQVFRPRRRLP